MRITYCVLIPYALRNTHYAIRITNMVAILETPVIANPLREGLRMQRTADPAAMVIFGITGDLAHRKLLPALYNLYLARQLPGGFSVVGFARRPLSDDELRAQAKESVERYSR